MKQSKQENIIYLVMWGLLFAAPLLSIYVRMGSDPDLVFLWSEVLKAWRTFAPFLLMFLIHNFLLAPLLVYKNKRVAYFSAIAVIIAVFTLYQCNSRPDDGRRPMDHQPPVEQHDGSRIERGPRPPQVEVPHQVRNEVRRHMPPPIIGEHDIVAVVVLILMFGANIGIKGFIRNYDNRKRLAELERQNLEQQLEYLKYQISPHFFMNTLNNIHALVDIDPAKAQETIRELSKMMRFVLYEGNKNGVPLSREMEFIQTYVNLMRLRYTDKVTITVDLPSEVPDKMIPPLLLISFVENAFKHGVSYQHPSFIYIKVDIGSKLTFICHNSKVEQPNQEKGGVGLANVRKRLDLLFDNNYTLQIDDASDVYSVNLVIPINSKP